MQRKNKGFNKKAVSLLICIVSAFSLWLYVLYVENPERTKWINDIPVAVLGESRLNEKGLALCDDPNATVDLKIRTKRSNFRLLSNETITATVDISSISQTGESTVTASVMLPSSVSDVTIVSKEKVDISFQIEKYVTSSFDVTPAISKAPPQGYSVHSSVMEGNAITVLVSGSESAVNRVAKVTTTPVDLSAVTEDYTKMLSFRAVDSEGQTVDSVSLDIDAAEITFEIYRTVEVPIEIKISSDHPSVTLEPERDMVEIVGPVDKVNAFIESGKSIQTTPVDEYMNQRYTHTTCTLINIPEGCQLKNQDDETVKVIITNNSIDEITQTPEA